MAIATTKELTQIKLEQNYKAFYERRGIPGIITWWVKIREDKIGKDLVINTAEKYDSIIINGKRVGKIK